MFRNVSETEKSTDNENEIWDYKIGEILYALLIFMVLFLEEIAFLSDTSKF